MKYRCCIVCNKWFTLDWPAHNAKTCSPEHSLELKQRRRDEEYRERRERNEERGRGPGRVTAAKIKKLRRRLRMARNSFAVFLGVSRHAVISWELNRNQPKDPARKILAKLISQRNTV